MSGVASCSVNFFMINSAQWYWSHLSKENNYEELAYEAVRLEVTMGDNPYKADDFPMYVAKRNAVSPVIRAE